MQRFLRIFFNPAVGCILLFAQYRRRFTKTLVEEAKERKLGSIKLVISRWCAGVAVLFTYYLIAWLFILLLSLILGAHCTGAEIWALTLYVFFGWILAVGSYGIALLFMFLIPFFLPAWLFYGFFAGVAPIILFSVDVPGYPLIRFLDQFLISYYTEAGYGSRVYGRNPGADQMGLSSDPPYLYGDILRSLDPFLLSEEKADHEKIEAGGRYGLCRVSGKCGNDRRDRK